MKIHDVFERADERGFGFVTRRDFRVVIESTLKIDLRDEELLWLMDEYDVERDGVVDYKRMLDDLAEYELPDVVSDPKTFRALTKRFDDALKAKAITDPHFDVRRAFGYDCPRA